MVRRNAWRSRDPLRRATRPPNKGMKQTKPAQAMELRSLSPVFDGPAGGAPNERSPRAAPAQTPVGRCQELGLQPVQAPHLIGQNRYVIGQNRHVIG